MAGLGSDIGVHAGPVETLEKVLFHFVDAIVTDKQFSVGIGEGFRDERCWQENYHSARFKLSFDIVFN